MLCKYSNHIKIINNKNKPIKSGKSLKTDTSLRRMNEQPINTRSFLSIVTRERKIENYNDILFMFTRMAKRQTNIKEDIRQLEISYATGEYIK